MEQQGESSDAGQDQGSAAKVFTEEQVRLLMERARNKALEEVKAKPASLSDEWISSLLDRVGETSKNAANEAIKEAKRTERLSRAGLEEGQPPVSGQAQQSSMPPPSAQVQVPDSQDARRGKDPGSGKREATGQPDDDPGSSGSSEDERERKDKRAARKGRESSSEDDLEALLAEILRKKGKKSARKQERSATRSCSDSEESGQGQRFRPEDVGYFDPSMKLRDYDDDDMIERKGKLFHRNVRQFVEAIESELPSTASEVVRRNVHKCLRGTAQAWYTSQLSSKERKFLQGGKGVRRWAEELVSRFRKRPSEAQRELQKRSFGFREVRDGRSIGRFIMDVVRLAKDADITTTEGQLLQAHERINVQLRRDLKAPSGTTTVDRYIRRAEDQYILWTDLAAESDRQARRSERPREQRETRFGERGNRESERTRNFRDGDRGGRYRRERGEDRERSRNAFRTNDRERRNRSRNTYGTNDRDRRPFPPRDRNRSRERARSQERNRGGERARSKEKDRSRERNRNRSRNGNRNKEGRDQARKPTAYHVDAKEDSVGERSASEDEQEDYPEPEQEEDSMGTDTDSAQGYVRYLQTIPKTLFVSNYQGGIAKLPELEAIEQEPVKAATEKEPWGRSAEGEHRCKECGATWPSRNAMHAHIRESHLKGTKKTRSKAPPKGSVQPYAGSRSQEPAPTLEEAPPDPGTTIRSQAAPETNPGMAFRNWNFVIAMAKLGDGKKEAEVIVDTGANMSVTDRAYLQAAGTTYQALKTKQPIPLQGINGEELTSAEYVMIPFTFRAKKGGSWIKATFCREVHLIDDAQGALLMGMDIQGPEGIVIDTPRSTLRIESCQGAEVPITVKPRSQGSVRGMRVKARETTTIPPRTIAPVRINFTKALPQDRDFEYTPALEWTQKMSSLNPEPIAYAHMMDAGTEAVWLRNDSDEPIRVARKQLMGTVADASLVRTSTAEGLDHGAAGFNADRIQPEKETRLRNGVTVYGEPTTVEALAKVVNKYPAIWTEKNDFVQIPEERLMTIPLKENWENDTKLSTKVYPMAMRDREQIDRTFDKLHEQGKMHWTKKHTVFGFPVFVAWRWIHKDGQWAEKPRVVVDIRGLNRITQKDSYPLPVQEDIISAVRGARYITVVDATAFFYQWKVKEQDRHKLTVNSHRGQESFNVAVMGFINSVAYVQRQLDWILRECREFARAYIDDLTIHDRTLEDHLDHLEKVFQKMDEFGITLNPKKSFVGYPCATLLGQRVNAFGLQSTEERAKALVDMPFPETLKDLEHWIGATGWLQSRIPYYAEIVKPLTDHKTALLKSSPVKGSARKAYTRRMKVVPMEDRQAAYEAIREHLRNPPWLIHHDPERRLYVDVDASKRGFGALLYHVKGDPEPDVQNGKVQPWADDLIQPIAFLSRVLKSAETRYWPTELEVAGIVWVLRKAKHMLHAGSRKSTYFFTDHHAATFIAQHYNLQTTSATDKMNLKLVTASQYISQFDLRVFYRPGKTHLVPDALSRLIGDRQDPVPEQSEETLDPIGVFSVAVVEMSDAMKERIQQGYGRDPHWKRILEVLAGIKERDAVEARKRAREDLAEMSAAQERMEEHDQGEAADDGAAQEAANEDNDPLGNVEEDVRQEVQEPEVEWSDALEELRIAAAQDAETPGGQTDREAPAPRPASEGPDRGTPGASPEPDPPVEPPGSERQKGRRRARQRQLARALCVDNPGGPEANEAPEAMWGLRFFLRNELIYYVDPEDGRHRLCIPSSVEQEVFQMAHDNQCHGGFWRAYNRIRTGFLIRKLAKKLRTYLKHCPVCQVCSTKRHAPYGELQPIQDTAGPRECQTMDFIVRLPPTLKAYDTLLTITCKVTKEILLIKGKENWSAEEWADKYTRKVLAHGWGFPRIQITDRDPKFTSKFWKQACERLGINQHMTTAYHPQADGQSERTNQTVEIAIRYHVVSYPDTEWTAVLPHIQASMNNAVNATTGFTPNQLLMGMDARTDPLAAMAEMPQDRELRRDMARREAQEAIAFAATDWKRRYDKRHKPLRMKKGDLVFVRLHQGYKARGHADRKFSHQRIGPFAISRKVGNLAYELQIPSEWRIHPVISVAHLEPAPRGKDPYGRNEYPEPGPVTEWDAEDPPYEIARLLDRREAEIRGRKVKKYLVQWKGWGPAHNTWIAEEALSGARELVQEYEEAHPTERQQRRSARERRSRN
uniref:RNA-directed DNA polymerase n=1 Tax=Diplodia seriata TaxID=420778 RepID=A0A1S8B6L5_9PEZI|nr:Retrovirus-related Pol polyprotein from transposon gypsy [Diplodia seriata]